MGKLGPLEKAFASVGWFIPPYVQLDSLSKLAGEILARGGQFTQNDLEQALERTYDAQALAAMVRSRYSVAPVIREYRETIAESIEAHFLGLHHVAVAGLIPVIEGAGRQLLNQRGLLSTNTKVIRVFSRLAEDCKKESVDRHIGDSSEVVSMMDSFLFFAKAFLYVDSRAYPVGDKTNRHGITHGTYTDADYGRPINFYKIIGAVDFLTFVSSFRANLSWFAPDVSPESVKLAAYYATLRVIRPVGVHNAN